MYNSLWLSHFFLKVCHRLAAGPEAAGVPEDSVCGVFPGDGGGIPQHGTGSSGLCAQRRTARRHLQAAGTQLQYTYTPEKKKSVFLQLQARE